MLIDVATYYRRRCNPSRLKLSLWHDRTWFEGWIVKGIEPEDALTDKEAAGYVLELVRRRRGRYDYDDRRVDAGAELQVAPGDPGLREVR